MGSVKSSHADACCYCYFTLLTLKQRFRAAAIDSSCTCVYMEDLGRPGEERIGELLDILIKLRNLSLRVRTRKLDFLGLCLCAGRHKFAHRGGDDEQICVFVSGLCRFDTN